MVRSPEVLGIIDVRIVIHAVPFLGVPKASFPRVTTDLKASAELAAKHFLERGFKHFAYFSLVGLPYVAIHQKAFADAIAGAEGDFALLAVKPRAGAEPDWNLDLAKLGNWLKSLAKPIGVLTWNPSSAREIIYACQEAGLLVPEEVAVLSGSDDELLCDLLHVPVSGIMAPCDYIGYKAARLLDQLMRGQPVPKQPELIAPSGVATRQSTDILAISDTALVKAMSYIRQNVARPIQVSQEVARQAGVSRRVLERRFIDLLNRPRLKKFAGSSERAKQMLQKLICPSRTWPKPQDLARPNIWRMFSERPWAPARGSSGTRPSIAEAASRYVTGAV